MDYHTLSEMYTTMNEDAMDDVQGTRSDVLGSKDDVQGTRIDDAMREVLGSMTKDQRKTYLDGSWPNPDTKREVPRAMSEAEIERALLDALRTKDPSEVGIQEPSVHIWIEERRASKRQRDANSDRIQVLEAQVSSLSDAVLRILEMVSRLEARFPEGAANKSAALKRDMTKADAERAIKDDRPHEVVAAELGLTYAQIYSCRLAYTFKDVHARLRKEGWVPIWIRGKRA